MPKVWITCTQIVTYKQQIVVSEEELERLRDAEGATVSEAHEPETYLLLQDRINHLDVYDYEAEYDDLTLGTDAEDC